MGGGSSKPEKSKEHQKAEADRDAAKKAEERAREERDEARRERQALLDKLLAQQKEHADQLADKVTELERKAAEDARQRAREIKQAAGEEKARLEAEAAKQQAEHAEQLRKAKEAKEKADAEAAALQKEKDEAEAYARFLKEYPIPYWLSVVINKGFKVIMLLGHCGIGKSTFVNTVCGLEEGSAGAARVGDGQQGTYNDKEREGPNDKEGEGPTKGPKFYVIKGYPRLVIADAGGYGTSDYKLDEYMKETGLRHVDMAFLMVKNRLQQQDVDIKEHLDQNNVPCKILRNQMEIECMHFAKKKKVTEEEAAETLKANFFVDAQEKFGKGRVQPGDVFFIDGSEWNSDNFDMPRLKEAVKAAVSRDSGLFGG